ncbi:X-ray repair cross-complementing protein 5 isoform X2 [Bradysia coprophila]|uniref:X-ray repair cross-complementing protein 5 isoform X2 n=1 Tax=Bradysia coprophila TaxID=38358 RepID=UPI00187D7C54|nr:X-ray repair cross-complementing protein 5 isoform X2 [Bradysia coprophila]
MATTKEATVILFDVGKPTGESVRPGQPTFFEQAKECLAKILQRKIFTTPKDEIGLILIGTDDTNNVLNDSEDTLGDYEHISVAFDLEMTNWQMLKILEREIVGPSNSEGDWLSALIVAMDFLKGQMLGKKFKSSKIILMSPFASIVNTENIDIVMEGLRKIETEIVVITCNVEYYSNPDKLDENDEMVIFSQTGNKSKHQKAGEKLAFDLIQQVNGILCSFEEAMVQLVYYEKQNQKSMPWNCELQIGSKLEIKTSVYVYTKDVSSMISWKTESVDGPCKMETEYFVQNIELKPVEKEELIRGHMYGTTPVPFDQSLGLKFDAGPKNFRCIGFTNRNNIHDQHLCGTGVWLVKAQKDAAASEKLFVALVNVMKSSELALVARYVYRSGLKAKIMVLVPHPDTEKNQYKKNASLLMMEVHFADDQVKMEFPPLRTTKDTPSQEQYDAVEGLIDSMDLMDAYDGDGDCNEAFAHKKLLNPTIQYTYRALAHRALHPTQPVPLPDQDLMDLLDIPEKIKQNSSEHVAKVKELFPLEPIVKPTKKLLFQMLQHNATAAASADDVQPTAVDEPQSTLIEVGTITPDEDFMHLLLRGEKFATVSNQMQNVLHNLVFKTLQLQTEKFGRAVMMYREQAIVMGAFRYNEWVTEFKKILLERGKVDVWQTIFVNEKFGLISAKETEMSTVTDEEVEEFYKNECSDTNKPADDMMDDDLDELLANM